MTNPEPGLTQPSGRSAPGTDRAGTFAHDLQRYDLSVPGREMIQSRVDVEPGSPAIRHTHPGEEIIYVLEGSLEYQMTASRRRCTTPARP